MHSFLTGTSVYNEMMTPMERVEYMNFYLTKFIYIYLFILIIYVRHLIMKNMRLYQHSAHCSVALQLFLEKNPAYWCFISRLKEEVDQENKFYTRLVLGTGNEFVFTLPKRTDQEKKVARLLTGISFPPAKYHYSSAQIQKQRIFFDRLLLSPVDELPYVETDLYKIKIIAVCK
jgi:hypothetical protein